jgi:hypothetical protein
MSQWFGVGVGVGVGGGVGFGESTYHTEIPIILEYN